MRSIHIIADAKKNTMGATMRGPSTRNITAAMKERPLLNRFNCLYAPHAIRPHPKQKKKPAIRTQPEMPAIKVRDKSGIGWRFNRASTTVA
jgi:hypothetical protein